MAQEQATVLVFTGVPGTGKSTVAEAVARRLGVPSFAGDWLFGAMAPTGVLDGVAGEVLEDLQHRLLVMLAGRQLALGRSAILDGLFSDAVLDDWSKQLGGALLVVQCVCTDETVHRRRLEARVRGIPGWHEVDWEHVLRMRARFPGTARPALVLDAMDPLAANVERVLDALPGM